jgi:type IX secretion system PorP/SprF family membrane protein
MLNVFVLIKRPINVLILFLSLQSYSFAQLSLASNFGSYPSYHNPAFTGINTTTSIWALSRQQWLNPQYDLSLIGTNVLGVDTFIDKFHIGIGGHISQERLNEGFATTSTSIESSFVDQWFDNTYVTVGMNVGQSFLSRTGNLSFIDQYQSNGTILPSSNDILANQNDFRRSQTTFGFGLLVEHFSELKSSNSIGQWAWQLAGSAKSIPFVSQNTGFPGSLPLYITLYGSTRRGLSNNDEAVMGYNFLFQKFGEVRQYTTGFSYYNSGLTLGLKYRGGLFTQKKKQDKRESVIFNVGIITTPHLKFGISWDQPFASGVKSGTIGSTELTVLYVFGIFKGPKGKGSENTINLKKISSNKKETDCERFRNARKNRKMYYLWPDR